MSEKTHRDLLPAEMYTTDEFGDRRHVGRPKIGRPVQCRYPAGLLDEIDAAAAAIGVGRPEWLRRAAQAVLDAGRNTPRNLASNAGRYTRR